jgi:ribonucleoside-diphosphate reductase alpha chain
MAPVPGLQHLPPAQRRQQVWPSTVAYIAALVLHRYAMLGVLDNDGQPLQAMGILAAPAAGAVVVVTAGAAAGAASGQAAGGAPRALPLMAGKPCPECGNHTLIHKDGCEFCTACGFVGQCG